jgi:molybdopterin molybdotransferase
LTELRTVAEHQAIVAALVAARPPLVMAVDQALGRVLAADYLAPRSLPPFDNSAMDGYAVHSDDIASATSAQPVTLPVTEDIPAGRVEIPRLAPGTAHRIMTGAMMPAGADAVVQVEATDGGESNVQIYQPRNAGEHVRPAGVDVRRGESVLSAGTTLGPAQLGLLAALGEAEVTVIPPIRVLVLSTGSELVEPGQPLQPGQIHESNSVMLAAAVTAAGGHAERLQFVADDVSQFLQTLQPHLGQADVVITSGGVSAGAYEVVKDALTGRGVEFAKVAMQPGMPQGAGTFSGTPFLTLPGNPVSALVSFEVFARPALRAAMGFAQTHRRVVRAALSELLRSPAGKRQFRRGVLAPDARSVSSVGPAGSHFLGSMAASNCLIDLPLEVTELAAGAVVDVWVLD